MACTDTDRLQDDLADAPIDCLRSILMSTPKSAIWRPRVEVRRLDHTAPFHIRRHPDFQEHAWYWRDLEESPRDQWRGPFANEGAGFLDAIKTYGVDHALHQ